MNSNSLNSERFGGRGEKRKDGQGFEEITVSTERDSRVRFCRDSDGGVHFHGGRFLQLFRWNCGPGEKLIGFGGRVWILVFCKRQRFFFFCIELRCTLYSLITQKLSLSKTKYKFGDFGYQFIFLRKINE